MKDIKLTDSEKVLMDILWEKKKIFMKDILEAYPDPKPAATTIATLLKRMQNKDLVGYTLYGNSREYYPKVEKGEYFKEEMTSMIDRFFNSSVTQFASFFTSNAKLSQKQLKELRDIIDEQIKE
ncbi:BlaI/MecI/CopY family transcriptional regulator [Chryseobacterium arthrosphaerae]|uniref:BlaI/MecI/CopY family transcriptional regulator n=1 Tax=Chryseobacterium arthrosphaerae TaxID=651561 RepID=A0A1B8ZAZ4_9FLAO|nr:BlaI/MecI/CopY family transcriptional regulator [Chryseobacterium arthrosphaerae]MDG4653182.1 BlaI/MecI/CopY family transcriptional regulator [Chryseobacterium arthrosphaerae]OCA68677.1 penicillinase repressor [Chryseobacterium arthrosphaerae]QUY55098.1 BlaI/MecI/CopY family transcriptional regulator [Chryseobacterium arthrosphaerae]UEQ74978.1 BlaI/MecI/CopY family transcriptional regulator [Chryseobacterium arthrosphaerae]WES96234.1 BlaI/MecI/CopY family transcriptional regulator [Chryseob